MKKPHVRIVLSILSLFLGLLPLRAAQQWDPNGATAGCSSTGGLWDTTTANWSTACDAGGNAAWTAGGDAVFSTSAAYFVTVNAGVSVHNITVNRVSPGAVSIVGTGAMTFSAGATLNIEGIAVLTAPYLAASSSVVVTKTGAGTLSLNNGTGYTGKWACTVGRLSAATDAQLGTVPGSVTPDFITLDGGGLRTTSVGLNLNVNKGITLGSGGGALECSANFQSINSKITGSGALSITGGAAAVPVVLLNTGNDYAGGTSIAASSLLKLGASGVIPDTSVVTMAGSAATLDLNGQSETIKSLSGTAGVVLFNGGTLTIANPNGETYSSSLNTGTGGGSIIMNAGTGNGQLILTASAASYSGGFTLNGGKLGIGALTFGTGTLTINGGSICANNGTGRAPTPAAVTLNANLTSDDTFIAGPGTLTWGAAIPWTISGGNRTYTINTAANNGYTVTINGTIGQDVSGRSLTKAGNGVLTLGGANTYTGGTTVSAGTVNVTGSIKGPVTVGSSGILKLNTTTGLETTANLTTAASPSANSINLAFTGTQTINSLTFGTAIKAPGTWGSTSSSAAHKNAAFTGTGLLSVTTGGTSTTSVTSDGTPSAYGNSVTFTVTVTGTGNGSTPAGNVTILDNGVSIATPTLSGAGNSATATFTTSALSVGAHANITASWAGDDNYGSSSSSAYSQTVNARVVSLSGSRNYDSTATAAAGILTVANKVGAEDVTVASGTATLAGSSPGSQAITSIGDLALGGAAAGNYTLSGATGSVTINPAPLSITAQDQTKTKGNTFAFSGTEFNSLGLQGGETIGSVTLTSAGADAGADVGTYPIVPSAATGGTFTAANYTITYHNGTLTVNDPPHVTSSPSSSTANAGSTVVLTITATGSPAPTYQWKKGGNNLSNGSYDNAATVVGASTANLTLAGVRAADTGVYTCVANNSAGTDTSAAATVTVTDPVITQQPVNSTFECGTSNALIVMAVGTTNANGVLTYQWYTPDPSGTAITDATNAVLSFPVSSFANGGSYSVVVSNGLGNSITSSVAVITIHDLVAPMITVNGGPAAVECHTSYTDLGASAIDACDGSVSVSTSGLPNVNAVGNYIVTYTATDSHGNSSTATRSVVVNDTTAPTISVTGSDVTVSCGVAYNDAGATANDSCAGNLTSQISVNYGGLNTSLPVAGVYTITYSVTDGFNPATPQNRVVTVIDNTAPVVTLNGGTVVTNECHTAFNDPGATANDGCAGNVTGSVVISGSLDTNTVGVYTLTYSADDGAGNTNSTVTRVVHVEDHTAPVVTLNGAAAVTVECHGSYSDPSASADDACTGSTAIVQSGTVDLNTVGVYTRTYTSTDASGNSASTTRQISVEDHTAPVVTINAGPSTVECHTSFSNPGATASDICDAAVTTATLSGSVDADTVGSYTLTYSATDASGNTGTATRVVTVSDGTAPVVTINAGPTTVECHGSFSNPGATASDTCDASVTTATLSGAVDVNTPGLYTLTYSATDGSSNTGTATRVVTVSDTLAPVVSLNGAASMTVECHSGFSDPGATANDACEGPVNVTTTGGPVDPNTVGNYTLTYTACDSGSRCSTATRVVHVNDSAAPSVTITGANPMTVECHGSFTDPGATASDDCDALANVVTTGSVNPNAVGSYTLTYTATDADGNTATDTRVVNVVDTTAPSITATGGDQTVECHDAYTDPGATASDACSGNLTGNIVVSGATVDANTPGVYVVTYTVADAANNSNSTTRTVTVQDTTAPVVTVTDPSSTNACQSQPYTDPGATANDACDGDLTGNIVVTGNVDTSIAGDYTLTYTATDAAGNSGSATRVVTVQPCDILISQQPQPQSLNAGDTLNLSVTAVPPNGGPALSYQWFKGASAIAGATDSAYSKANVLRADAASYHVHLVSGINSLDSDTVAVTVADPTIVSSPASRTINVPATNRTVFTVVASGTAVLRYQWLLNGTKITGATTPNYTLTNIVAGMTGRSYSCVVSNAGGHTATSATAVLTVRQAPTSVAITPATQSVYVGSNAYFKVTVTPPSANLPQYGGPVVYQWVKGTKAAFTVLNDGVSGNGSTLSGTQTASFAIQNVQLGDTGSYCCIVTNATATNVFSAVSRLVAKDYTTAPTVVITKAIQNAKYLTNPVTMNGTATDLGLISDVWLTQTTFGAATITNEDMTFVYRSNSLHQPIPGSVLWTNVVNLAPGTNVFVAYAQNGKGTNGFSKPPRLVFLLERSSLNLIPTPSGHGTIVSSNLTAVGLGNPVTGTNVYVNIGYTVTARPAIGKHFLGWFDGSDNPYPSSPANTNKILRFTIPDTNGVTLKATFD